MYSKDSFTTKKSFFIDDSEYFYFSLKDFFSNINVNNNKFPYSLKVLLENNLRNEDGININSSTIKKFGNFFDKTINELEIVANPNLCIEMFLVRLMYLKGYKKNLNIAEIISTQIE